MKSWNGFGIASTAIILAVAPNTYAGLTQWRIEDGGNGNWYGLTTNTGSWEAMEAEAVAVGGHLASIQNTSENSYIYSLISQPNSGATFACWLGMMRDPSGPWYWSDGSPTDYFNWTGGEPNNAQGNERWVWMYSTGGGGWNDHWPQYSLNGVIEVVPTPAGAVIFAVAGLAARRRRR
jgi:hypothetical protein